MYLTHIFFHRVTKVIFISLLLKRKKEFIKSCLVVKRLFVKKSSKGTKFHLIFFRIGLKQNFQARKFRRYILSGHKIHTFYRDIGQHKNMCSLWYQFFFPKRRIFPSVYEINMFFFSVTAKTTNFFNILIFFVVKVLGIATAYQNFSQHYFNEQYLN